MPCRGCAADDVRGAAGIGLIAIVEDVIAVMGGKLSASGGFFANADFDFEARIALGSTASGIGDVGLVLATLDRITDGDSQSWFDAWTSVAADLAARGARAGAARKRRAEGGPGGAHARDVAVRRGRPSPTPQPPSRAAFSHAATDRSRISS